MDTRRLTAIMFSDIVGYTAMMQSNEKKGRQSTQYYRLVLEELVLEYQGEIYSHYGDGSLCLFASSIQALRCAMELQNKMGVDKKVKIRIGLHIGDVVLSDDDLYGDGVNIASRVESIGAPGAVLMSERFKYDLKSHPEFQLKSLGHFRLKNVDEPMEVFALSNEGFYVPNPDELKGKAERIGTSEKDKVKQQGFTWRTVGIILSALLIGFLALLLATNKSNPRGELPSEIKNERLAILVFDNQTGDSSLNTWGHLVSELVTQGFMQTGKVSVVVPTTVRQYMQYVGTLPGKTDEGPAFADLTGARYMVGGSYYLDHDTLIVSTHIDNALSGEQLFHFPLFKRHVSDKMLLAEDVQQNLMGYWFNQEDIAKLKHGVPLYEAYQWNLKGVNTGRQDYLKKAIELDPNFYQPYVWLITNYYWMNRMDLVDSVWNVVQPSWDKFTRYEQNMLSSAYAFSEKRYNDAYRYAYENARQYPEDYYSSTEAGMLALVWLNQPHHCLNILAKLTQQKFDYDNEPSKSRWLIYYHQALIRLGKFDEVEASCLSLASQHIQNFNAVLRPLVTTYGLQGNRASIEEMLSETEREAVFPRYIINNLMGMGVYYLALGGHRQEALELKDELLKRIRQDPSDPPMSLSREISLHILYRGSAAGLHYFTQDWKAALREIQSSTFTEFKDYVYYLGRLGAIYARLGERDLALLIIDKLMEKNRQNQELVGFDSSLLFYCIAQIQALLGDKSEAVATLNHALEAGMGHIFEFVHFDMDLESLRGYPPFDELLQPDD